MDETAACCPRITGRIIRVETLLELCAGAQTARVLSSTKTTSSSITVELTFCGDVVLLAIDFG
jgi:hypothetical protein